MLRRSLTCLMAVGAFSALLTLTPPKALALPTLQVENGILMGATGVDVDGTLYDVQFVDGTCAALFQGCDQVTDFSFQTDDSSRAAAQALLDQVFLDGPQGNFNSTPSLTNGCISPDTCHTVTPYGFFTRPLSETLLMFSSTYNSDPAYNIDQARISSGNLLSIDSSIGSGLNWAVWTPHVAHPVPEPSTMFLLISSLLGLIGYRWRRQAGLQIG